MADPRQRAIDAVAFGFGAEPREMTDAFEVVAARVIERVERAGLVILDVAERDDVITHVAEAFAILEHHGDASDPHCTQDGNQALRAVHSALDALGVDPHDYAQRAAESGGTATPDADHASIDSADDERVHGRTGSRESVTAASSPRSDGDASRRGEGSAFPTLALAQFTSPMEQRVLWLSLYAAAFARGLGPDASIVVARGGVAELSAAIVADVSALPSWLREHDDENKTPLDAEGG